MRAPRLYSGRAGR